MPVKWAAARFFSNLVAATKLLKNRAAAYSRVVTPDPWRHVTFVNYQNGCGRAED